MGHTPDAKKGMELIQAGNSGILEAIAAARLEEDHEASIAAIKERHTNELKAAKRNFKHRKKKLVDKMKSFEDMSPTQLADAFPDGDVPENVMSNGSSFIGMDFSQLESRMHRMLTDKIMTHEFILPSRQMGKSEAFRRAYGGNVTLAIKDISA